MLIYYTVECGSAMGMGHSRRQLRYLQKPHHGPLLVATLLHNVADNPS
jgi:hypothetical protein